MKKLLSLLASIGIVAGGAATVVACGNNELTPKDDNGGNKPKPDDNKPSLEATGTYDAKSKTITINGKKLGSGDVKDKVTLSTGKVASATAADTKLTIVLKDDITGDKEQSITVTYNLDATNKLTSTVKVPAKDVPAPTDNTNISLHDASVDTTGLIITVNTDAPLVVAVNAATVSGDAAGASAKTVTGKVGESKITITLDNALTDADKNTKVAIAGFKNADVTVDVSKAGAPILNTTATVTKITQDTTLDADGTKFTVEGTDLDKLNEQFTIKANGTPVTLDSDNKTIKLAAPLTDGTKVAFTFEVKNGYKGSINEIDVSWKTPDKKATATVSSITEVSTAGEDGTNFTVAGSNLDKLSDEFTITASEGGSVTFKSTNATAGTIKLASAPTKDVVFKFTVKKGFSGTIADVTAKWTKPDQLTTAKVSSITEVNKPGEDGTNFNVAGSDLDKLATQFDITADKGGAVTFKSTSATAGTIKLASVPNGDVKFSFKAKAGWNGTIADVTAKWTKPDQLTTAKVAGITQDTTKDADGTKWNVAGTDLANLNKQFTIKVNGTVTTLNGDNSTITVAKLSDGTAVKFTFEAKAGWSGTIAEIDATWKTPEQSPKDNSDITLTLGDHTDGDNTTTITINLDKPLAIDVDASMIHMTDGDSAPVDPTSVTGKKGDTTITIVVGKTFGELKSLKIDGFKNSGTSLINNN